MADINEKVQNSVYSILASCQDCYRCVRVCPVEAIQVYKGQASIKDELCISCGICVHECPQHAKAIKSSLERVKDIIQSGRPVAVSLAPSFASAFPEWKAFRLPTALRKLGFSIVAETAEGAKLVTEKSFDGVAKGSICTACPTVVNYIEYYRPEYLSRLIPIVSPMIAHGRQLKKRNPGCAVVFIGPCAAKKEEMHRPENEGAIDEVLTFNELIRWMEEEGVELEGCKDGSFDAEGDVGEARLFPIQGGMLKTGDISCDGTNAEVLHVSGSKDVMELFNVPVRNFNYEIVEPLFCKGGCINGPGQPNTGNRFERKRNIIEYAREAAAKAKGELERDVDCEAVFRNEQPDILNMQVDDDKIFKVFEATGKSDEKHRLNCGACGYKSCLENARAVVLGMAEPEMCIPYMRRLAQQRTDRILEHSPAGIVILDRDLKIVSMNPSFCRMFMCSDVIKGKRISYLVDAEGFERLLGGFEETCESVKSKYGIKYHELLYALRDENQYVGIYSDISQLTFDENQLNLIKNQTIMNAKELLDHQIRFSQQMAQYLGRSTAQSEELVKRLIEVYGDENEVL